MQIYVARLSGDGDRQHEIVGIFATEQFEDLFWMIDQACDPGAVEVAALGAGGLYWDGMVKLRIPVELDDEGNPVEDFPGLPDSPSLCEEWHDPFFGGEDVEWLPPIKP